MFFREAWGKECGLNSPNVSTKNSKINSVLHLITDNSSSFGCAYNFFDSCMESLLKKIKHPARSRKMKGLPFLIGATQWWSEIKSAQMFQLSTCGIKDNYKNQNT